MKFHFLLLIIPLLLLGCSKAKNPRWYVADITVLDYYTHQPVKFYAKMTYADGSGFGQFTMEEDDLGEADENGNLKIEEKIRRQTDGHTLKLFASGYNPPCGYECPFPAYQTTLVKKGKNKMTLYWKQYRLYKLHIINTNCLGANDSLWVNSLDGLTTYTALFTGCQDTLYEYGGFNHYTQNETITFHVKSKKDGVVTAFDQTFNVNTGFQNILEIEY